MRTRFTLDGSETLEQRMTGMCARVRESIQNLLPAEKLEGLVLGGGYGRGQGGVLRTEAGEEPYNDLEFYVFLRGHPVLSERRYGAATRELEEKLTGEFGLHTEFKLDSLERLRHAPVSMFSYDLVAGHKVLVGDGAVFKGCEHHLSGGNIPLSEATRLLLNRCTGLLFVKELLWDMPSGRNGHSYNNHGPAAQPPQNGAAPFKPEETDFIGRNLAKARLAAGDAVLTAFGEYHWNCIRRHSRLAALFDSAAFAQPPLSKVGVALLRDHAAGIEFKLHPVRIRKSREAFEAEHREISEVCRSLWLWLESRRLGRPFRSTGHYAQSRVRKCPGTAPWRNGLLNLRTFGPSALLRRSGWRYPRERLLNALPLLLWDGEEPGGKGLLGVQRELGAESPEWRGLLTAYREVWPSYG